MEIFPSKTIESSLQELDPNAYMAVTCSPSLGVDVTLEMTERLVARGYRVVPHLAAKRVRNRAHLGELVARIRDLPVDSIFVPGGDGDVDGPHYHSAFELLQDLSDLDHGLEEIGVAAHPEGHPVVSDKRLMVELEKKQPLATYMVTQLCFHAHPLQNWLASVRERGIHLPVWLGIPGVSDRASLLKTSLRIGVGDSLRFLRQRGEAAGKLMKQSRYTPDDLLSSFAPIIADPLNKIDGLHIFCFNLVDQTERWRKKAVAALENGTWDSEAPGDSHGS